jgi:hypothetical protein
MVFKAVVMSGAHPKVKQAWENVCMVTKADSSTDVELTSDQRATAEAVYPGALRKLARAHAVAEASASAPAAPVVSVVPPKSKSKKEESAAS